jgi:hypothetical protein
MQTEKSVEIERSIEDVFNYTTKKVAEWSIIVVEDEVIEEKPEGVGTKFRTVTEDRGSRMEFEGVITHHEPPTAHAVLMKGKQFDIKAEYFFEDIGGHTRVTQRSTVKAKGLLNIVFFLFGWLMRKSSCDALERELSNLKQLMEDD